MYNNGCSVSNQGTFNFAKGFDMYNFGIFTSIYISFKMLVLVVFCKESRIELGKKWILTQQLSIFFTVNFVLDSILKTPEATTHRYSFKVFSRNPEKSCIKIVLKQVSILMHEKSLILSQSTRKEISKFLTNTNQSHFFLSLVKFFKKILCNSIFEFVQENCLLCDNQSGFRLSDSCEYQLFSIVYDIYASFDCNLSKDVRGIFLDITKAFDRVWHKGLICKMKCIGMTGMPLKLLQSFLQNRHQQVLLNGQCLSGAPVFCWCTPGFYIGPLFFLIYIYK